MDSTAPQSSEITVKSLDHDLACVDCAYALRGQPIVRESVYGILIVRCPECGRVHPAGAGLDFVQTRKRSGVKVLTWWLFFLILITGTGGAFAGLAQSTGFLASRTYALAIADAQRNELAPTRSYSHVFDQINFQWWSTSPDRQSQIWTSLGEWRAAPNWIAVADIAYVIPIAFVFAITWAIALPHVNRRQLQVLGAISIVIGSIILAMYYAESMVALGLNWEYAMTLAEWRIGIWFAIATMFAALVVFECALLVSRPIARFVIATLAPRTVQNSLQELWSDTEKSSSDAR